MKRVSFFSIGLLPLNALLPLLALNALLAGCGGDPTQMPAGPVSHDIQIDTPPFTLMPGDEVFKCFYTSLPSDTSIDMVKFHSTMTPGSHHMILFYTTQRASPDGTFSDCAALERGSNDGSTLPFPLLLTQEPDSTLQMPDGVAMTIKAHQPLVFQMHYINATTAPLTAQVKLTVTHVTDGKFIKAGPFASYSTKIAIPPHGTQTVQGHCAVPSGVSFFSMTTHSHKNTTSAGVNRWSNDVVGESIVETKDWAHPTVRSWTAPYFSLLDSEELYYTCSYMNNTDSVIKTGQSAASNEMCMAIGYYFPASRTTVCIDSMSFTL